MLEIEAKYPVSDFAPIETTLRGWGAKSAGDRADADHYFNGIDRDFAKTDEAFRLRRIGSANFVTYKGPKVGDPRTKTRKEIEIALAEGDRAADEFREMLVLLGFRPVTVVRKRRRTYELKREGFEMSVTLDEVEEVGRYVELEIIGPDEVYESAKAVLLRAAEELGLGPSERRSYLQLLLEKRGAV